jgi:hypothetical protein
MATCNRAPVLVRTWPAAGGARPDGPDEIEGAILRDLAGQVVGGLDRDLAAGWSRVAEVERV